MACRKSCDRKSGGINPLCPKGGDLVGNNIYSIEEFFKMSGDVMKPAFVILFKCRCVAHFNYRITNQHY